LIDSTLKFPLFLRDKNGKIITNFLDVNFDSEENRAYKVGPNFFQQINKLNYQKYSKGRYIFLIEQF